MILNETFTMANGVKIPKLGLGTWEIPNENAAQAVRDAVAAGYRHIDTAQGYMNEAGVGEGVRTCGVPRERVFVTTKLQAFYKTYEEAKAAIEESLKVSGLEYFDMMLIHAPQPWTDFREDVNYDEGNLAAWRAMEEAVEEGKLRAIGVSNFEKADLENIIQNGKIKPVVNQILAHISNTPKELITFCSDNNILVEAYSPMGHGVALSNPQIKEMADKYHVSVSQLCIRYCLQLGMVAIPKTANPAHMKNNADVDFEISGEDMEALMNMETIKSYGEFAQFPVYGGKMNADNSCEARNFVARK